MGKKKSPLHFHAEGDKSTITAVPPHFITALLSVTLPGTSMPWRNNARRTAVPTQKVQGGSSGK